MAAVRGQDYEKIEDRARCRLCGARRRKLQEIEGAACRRAVGQQRKCFHRRISHLGKKSGGESFLSWSVSPMEGTAVRRNPSADLPSTPLRTTRSKKQALQLPIFAFRLYIARAHRGGIAMELWSRRKFFLTSLASSFIAGAGQAFGRAIPADAAAIPSLPAQGARPILISSANGLHALDKG